jgi:predicted dehydrogenase
MTWLMDDARPVSVTAVTRRFKPEVYSRVDDETTIILEYPGAQAIIQASWNWPFDRKDMEVYGRTGQLLTVGPGGLRVRLPGKPEEVRQAPPLSPPGDDFLRYFAAIVRGEVRPSGPSSFRNNLIVTEILDAARRSAATGSAVRLI